ncbi:MAG: type II toxin-antitoxin system VapC family toxin [Blastocatellia bacterium]
MWDTNILTHFVDGQAMLQEHLRRTPWSEIALPSVVVAEALRGRCEFALKAAPAQLPLAHQLLRDTQQLLQTFEVVVFNQPCALALAQLQKQRRGHKRYTDMMIAATALALNHIVVTRNTRHFADLQRFSIGCDLVSVARP